MGSCRAATARSPHPASSHWGFHLCVQSHPLIHPSTHPPTRAVAHRTVLPPMSSFTRFTHPSSTHVSFLLPSPPFIHSLLTHPPIHLSITHQSTHRPPTSFIRAALATLNNSETANTIPPLGSSSQGCMMPADIPVVPPAHNRGHPSLLLLYFLWAPYLYVPTCHSALRMWASRPWQVLNE